MMYLNDISTQLYTISQGELVIIGLLTGILAAVGLVTGIYLGWLFWNMFK